MFDPAMRTPYGKQHVTARARTRCRLAVLPRDQLDSQTLLGVAEQQTSRLQARSTNPADGDPWVLTNPLPGGMQGVAIERDAGVQSAGRTPTTGRLGGGWCSDLGPGSCGGGAVAVTELGCLRCFAGTHAARSDAGLPRKRCGRVSWWFWLVRRSLGA
jgi:hypothetical protein